MLFQPVDWTKKLFLAHGVICGMEYLHSISPHAVIHGDLKIQNVLVGDGLVAKVRCTPKPTLCIRFIHFWFMHLVQQTKLCYKVECFVSDLLSTCHHSRTICLLNTYYTLT